jgi:hypothetical protein
VIAWSFLKKEIAAGDVPLTAYRVAKDMEFELVWEVSQFSRNVFVDGVLILDQY